MAIETPLANTAIQSRDYSNPYNTANAQAVNQQRSQLTDQDTAAQNAKLKSFLEGKSLDQQKSMLDKLKKQNPNSQVKAGDLSVGVDPSVAMQKKMMDTTAKESGKLQDVYGKDAKDLEGAASQVESGLTGLSQATPQGDKTAVAALTRLADGKGQRMTQAQLASMTPESAQGTAEKMMNYWSGQAESGLSDAQRQGIAKLLNAHSGRIQNEYSDSLNEFKEHAPMLAPQLAASGQLDPFIKSFGSKGSAIFDRIGKLNSTLPYNNPQLAQAGAPKAAPEGMVAQAANKLSGLKNFLMGSGTGGQGSAVAAPPAPQQGPQGQPQQPGQAMPTGPAAFDPDSFLSGK